MSRSSVLIAALVGLCPVLALAQGAAESNQRPEGVAAAIQAVIDRFDAAAPQIGERVQNVTIVDDLGNPVNLREIATEQYTVIVLGCLT